MTLIMFSTSFSVGSPISYRVPSLELPGQVHQIQVDFEDGEHTFTSPDFQLGTLHSAGSRPLMGRLTFRYSYDSTNRVCGTDYSSADGMTLVTMPQGTDQACSEHAASGGFVADEVYGNSQWNYHSQLTPGAATIIKNIVRGANDALIAALETVTEPKLIVQVRKTLPELPLEHYLNLCLVFRNGKFLETYNHTSQYAPHDQVVPLESVFGGIVMMNYGENFANGIGSTGDPKIAGLSWIRLWADQFGIYPTICTSQNYNGFPCNSVIYGGHVISGQTARVVAKGSDSVYIFPICNAHNNNNNVDMAALQFIHGVWLRNYLGP